MYQNLFEGRKRSRQDVLYCSDIVLSKICCNIWDQGLVKQVGFCNSLLSSQLVCPTKT